MTQRFTPAADRRLRRIALGTVVMALLLIGLGVYRTNAASAWGVGEEVPQPIPFSHAQHVAKIGMACATCHASATAAMGAGMPSNETCLTCHAQLFRGTPALQPLHDAAAAGRQIAWNAVTRLSSVSRFHHGAHARAGVGCTTCHGSVETMVKTVKVETMSMDWCVDCHRGAMRATAANAVRPVSPWHRDLTECSVCHY